MTIRDSVKKETTSRPWALMSVKAEALVPPKGRYATGAGIPTLMPSIPARASILNRRAQYPLWVYSDAPFP